jgi:putative SOS response-associated peptidase YedK
MTSAPEAIRALFRYPERPNFPPRYNVAPTQPVPIVRVVEGERHFALVRWGLIPSWVEDPKAFSLVINARGESVNDKPAFKNAMKRRRCLFPADGFYEWKQVAGRKRAYFARPRSGGPIAFAGLWETWMGPNGEEMDSVAIVTAPASRDLAVLHHRVPVTIAPDDFERWLDVRANDADEVMPLLTGPAEGEFAWHEISTRVNRVANDDAQLLLPITDEERAAEQPKPKKAPRKAASAADEDEGQGSLF